MLQRPRRLRPRVNRKLFGAFFLAIAALVAQDPTSYLTPDVMEEGGRLFDEAERLSNGDHVAADYVSKARLGLRYVRLIQHPTSGPEFRAFMSDVRKRGITELREAQPLDNWEREYLAKAPKGP